MSRAARFASPLADERAMRVGSGLIGVLGPVASSMTLLWLASHRERLRTLVLGSKRLSVLVVWDTKGSQPVDHTDAEVAAMRAVLYGEPRA